MKKKVYIKESDILLLDNEVLDDELVTYDVVTTTGETGKILEVFFASSNNKIIRVLLDKEILIPVNSPMLKEVNKKEKKIIIELISGM